MPATSQLEQAVLGKEFGGVTFTPPATQFFGLILGAPWTAGTVIALNTFIVGSAFATSNRHIFKCTTGGTTGGSEPTWNQTVGSTTTDNTVVWTETSTLFGAGSFTNAEPTAGAYARVSATNNTVTWTTPSGSDPASVSNAIAISFPQSTAAWGYASGFLISDAGSGGNYRAWGLLNQTLAVLSSNITPSFPIGSLVVNLT